MSRLRDKLERLHRKRPVERPDPPPVEAWKQAQEHRDLREQGASIPTPAHDSGSGPQPPAELARRSGVSGTRDATSSASSRSGAPAPAKPDLHPARRPPAQDAPAAPRGTAPARTTGRAHGSRALDAVRDPARGRVRSVERSPSTLGRLRMVPAEEGEEVGRTNRSAPRQPEAGVLSGGEGGGGVSRGSGAGVGAGGGEGWEGGRGREAEVVARGGHGGREVEVTAAGWPALRFEGREGSVMVVRTEVSLAVRHGKRALGEWLAEAGGGTGVGGGAAFDLETTGLRAERGAVMAMAGLARLDRAAGVVCVEQSLLRREGEEAAALEWLALRFGALERVWTWNGKSFDLPFVRVRAGRVGVGVPEPEHEDLYLSERRSGRRGRLRLTDVEARRLGFRREGDLPGSEAPARFARYFATGDPDAVRAVLAHNRDDVISTLVLGWLRMGEVE